MKALSLWQPWATLIAIGAKQYETRSWATAYRGPLVIHAAKSNEGLSCIRQPPFRLALAGQHWNHINDIPRGVALCVVDLVDCIRTDKIRASLSEQERAFGDYSDRRYAWKLVNVRIFKAPIPMRGAQGLFDCTVPLDELEKSS